LKNFFAFVLTSSCKVNLLLMKTFVANLKWCLFYQRQLTDWMLWRQIFLPSYYNI
jgi:hypothetical protein